MKSRRVTPFFVALTLVVLIESGYIIHQQDQIEGLNFRILSLQYQNSVLSSRCNALELNMSEVLGELEDEIKELKTEYTQLKMDYEALQYDYNNLEYDFGKLQENNNELMSQFGNYTVQYKQLRETINSRLALDGNLSRFVTPRDPAVKEMMLEITGGREDPESTDEFWEDTRALYDWVTERISYGADSPYPYLYSDPSYPARWFEHSVRYPNETLIDGTGDCEDQAILLLSMMMAHNEQYAMWCISLKWEGDGHLAVAFPVAGGRMAILDPSGGYISGTAMAFSSEPVGKAVGDWINILDDPDVHVSSVFNDELYVEFESTKEFIEWFNSNYS